MTARALFLALVTVAMTSSPLLAEPPSWAGGGRGGGGKPDSPDLYGDLVLIDRDVNGVPITTLGLGPKDQWTQVPQPIMIGPKAECVLWPPGADPDPGLIPVDGDSIYLALGVTAYRIPFVDGEIPEAYAACSTEADFGRLSSARAPEEVIGHALLEMVTSLSVPGGVLALDEAGRLTVSYEADGEWIVKTIDAPLEDLAGFERVLEAAELSHPEVNAGDAVEMPARPADHTGALHLLDRAAAMLGAAADKSGYVGIDVTVYTTQIRTIPADMTQEARDLYGMTPQSGYFNFGAFAYDRSATYAGDVCYLKVMDPGEANSLPVAVTGDIVKEPILQLVFPPLADAADYVGGLTDQGDYTGFTGSNVWAFARAADDARAVIQWVHDHPVPIELIEYCELDMQ
ncbi:MAG: hypothetical protein PVG98_14660 [Chromatiales bacterium]